MRFIFALLFSFNSFAIICDSRPSGNCSQADGSDTCRITRGSYCSIARTAGCSKVTNNGGVDVFMGGKDNTSDWEAFHSFTPSGISISSCTCAGGLQRWRVGTEECEAFLPELTHGQPPFTIRDDETSVTPSTGAANFTCDVTTISAPSGASCGPSTPGCIADGQLSGNDHVFASNSYHRTIWAGTQTECCNTNAYARSPSCPGRNCEAIDSAIICGPAPGQCNDSPLRWSQNGNQCEMAVGVTDLGTPINAVDNIGTTGTASFTCTNAGWSAPNSPLCRPGAPAGCPAGVPFQWNGNTPQSSSIACNGLTARAGVLNERQEIRVNQGGAGFRDTRGTMLVQCNGVSWEPVPFSNSCDCPRIGNDPNEDCE